MCRTLPGRAYTRRDAQDARDFRGNYFPALPNVPDPENNKLRFYIFTQDADTVVGFRVVVGTRPDYI